MIELSKQGQTKKIVTNFVNESPKNLGFERLPLLYQFAETSNSAQNA